MTNMHNVGMQYDLLKLRKCDISQAEALALIKSLNYELIPGLTLEEDAQIMRIAFPDTPVVIDLIHNEDWFDDDSVSDEEKLAWVKAHGKNMK